MRTARVISISIDRDLLLELEKFRFAYFRNNRSETIREALKSFLPEYVRQKAEFQKFLASVKEEMLKEED